MHLIEYHIMPDTICYRKKHIGKIRRSAVSESSPVELQFTGPGIHMKEMRNLGFRNSWNKSKLIQ